MYRSIVVTISDSRIIKYAVDFFEAFNLVLYLLQGDNTRQATWRNEMQKQVPKIGWKWGTYDCSNYFSTYTSLLNMIAFWLTAFSPESISEIDPVATKLKYIPKQHNKIISTRIPIYKRYDGESKIDADKEYEDVAWLCLAVGTRTTPVKQMVSFIALTDQNKNSWQSFSKNDISLYFDGIWG